MVSTSERVLAGFDRDVLLATGRAVRIRPSRRGDVPAMRAFYDALSHESTYFRFFGLRPALLDDQLYPEGGHDVGRHVVLVAEDGADIIAAGEYWRVAERDEAEVAFAVADSRHHQGIATILLEDLALIARAAGLRRLVAETLAGNEAMLHVFRSVGLTTRTWYEQGQVGVELDLVGTELLEDEADGRDWKAAVASLRPLFAPAHVAVVGAGRDPTSPGRIILDNLQTGFGGRLSVVHPTRTEVDGVPAVADVAELDPVPDLAVVAVPAEAVVGVIDACGGAGVRSAIVISSGFAEEGGAGIERERELLATARGHGMRVVGPNCLGVVATGSGLDATFMQRALRSGSIAIASQSGGVGVIVIDEAARRDLGVSAFVSMGNKVDVSGNDLLRYWADDPATRVVLMYLESIGDPVKFARVARAVSRRLPVVALKGGRTEAGRRGAQSHTAALAADDSGIDALFAHTGVVRASTLDQLLDVGTLLAAQPAPAGRRVALIGNAGGPLILAADAAAANGLDVVELSKSLQERLRAAVPDAAATANPVDLLATVTPAAMGEVLDLVADSGEIDCCAVISVDLAGGAEPAVPRDWINESVPAVAVLFGASGGGGSLPVYPSVERAIDALALAARRGLWLASTETGEAAQAEDVDLLPVRQRARRLAAEAATPGWLEPAATFGLLSELGVPVVPWATADSAAEAARAATRLGFPCVLKANVTGVVHKSDEGAVALDIGSAAAVRRQFASFRRAFGARLQDVVVQHQAEAGVELLIGGVRDPAIGPLVVVAAGGVQAELLRDRSVVLAPLTVGEAAGALERLRSFPLLRGFRGRPVVPLEPLVGIIHRIGLLMSTVPEIAELDLNPVIASPSGSAVVDARISVALPPVAPLRAMRVPRH
jgi:acyl-CoA synthetase (NDP forming)/GNAT superfamily N-acetyltransferase